MSPFAAILDAVLHSAEEPDESAAGIHEPSEGRTLEDRIAELWRPSFVTATSDDRPAWAVELGVSFPCTLQDLRRAFRKLAFRAHPDREGGSHEAFLRAQALLDEAIDEVQRAESRRTRPIAARYHAAGYRAAGSDSAVRFAAYA